jgi:hypothetical protein
MSMAAAQGTAGGSVSAGSVTPASNAPAQLARHPDGIFSPADAEQLQPLFEPHRLEI